VAAAAAILRIANDKMAGAIRMMSLARGEDPRDFALFAFGGAGPLHAAALAAELGIPQVLIPPRPGITNAIGCVVADARYDFVQTVNQPLAKIDIAEVSAILRAQVREGEAALAREKTPIVGITVLHSADMQFRGQTHLLRVALASAALSREELQDLFERAYFERFAVKLPEIGAMLINLNTSVIGQRKAVRPEWLIDRAQCTATLAQASSGRRPVWFEGGWRETPVYARERLPLNARFAGPAIIQQLDTTVVIEPGNGVTVDAYGNLLIDVVTKQ
jgi:N-methylhydantoinase A